MEKDKKNKKKIIDWIIEIILIIIIIILLLIIGFLIYLLYNNNYFDKFFNKESNVPVEKEESKKEEEKEKIVEEKKEEEKEEEKKKEPTLEELKKEYANLLDNYYVTDTSVYLTDFYDGKLTDDMMKYMTLNSFNFSTLEKEEDYNIIKDSTFKTEFLRLFDSDYTSNTFNFDENKVRFVKGIEYYMTSELLVREDNSIKREIKDIKVDGEKIIITTVEGVVKDNKLYNVITNDEVEEYKEESLLKYEDKLNKLVYTFKNNKLINLSK